MNPIRSIGGVTTLRAPSSYDITVQNVHSESSGRGMDATAWIEIIARKHKLEVAYNGIPFTDGLALLQATSPNFFSVNFLTSEGTWQTKQFYRSDVKAKILKAGYWEELSFGLIER